MGPVPGPGRCAVCASCGAPRCHTDPPVYVCRSDNMLDDASAAALGDALSKNPALQVLQLASNRIGDAGAVALAAGLSGNRNLKDLKCGREESGWGGVYVSRVLGLAV